MDSETRDVTAHDQPEHEQGSIIARNITLSQSSHGYGLTQPFNINNHLFTNAAGQTHMHNPFIGNSFAISGDMNIGAIYRAPEENSADTKKLLLRALYFKEMHLRRKQIGKRAGSSESNRWVWSTQFNEWLRGPLPLFWISGLPGSGKSTLMKHLTESEGTRKALNSSNSSKWKVLHFFFDFRSGSSVANSVEGLVRSLLYQLVNEIPELAKQLHNDQVLSAEDDWKERYQDLENLLEDFCEAVGRSKIKVCAFIDGLDEFQGRPSELLTVLDAMKSRTSLKMCLASRPEPSLEPRFSKYPHIFMQDHNSESMRWYIDYAWDEVGADKSSPAIHKFSDEIITHARGSFLWTRIVIDEVTDGFISGESIEQLAEKVRGMPKEVEDLYESTLERLPHRLRCEAAILLRMLVDAGGTVEFDRLESTFWTLQERGHLGNLVLPKSYCASFKSKVMVAIGGFVDISCNHHLDSERRFVEIVSDTNSCTLCSVQESSSRHSNVTDPFIDHSGSQVTLGHETFISFFRKRRWLSQRLPPQLLQDYPDKLWLRFYVAKLSNWLSSLNEAWMQPGSVMSNAVHWYDDFVEGSYKDLHGFFLDPERILEKLAISNWTRTLTWALESLPNEPERHDFFENEPVLFEAMQIIQSPIFLVHPTICQLRVQREVYLGVDVPCGVDVPACTWLHIRRSGREALRQMEGSHRRAPRICIAHGCTRALITYLRSSSYDNSIDLQFTFDLFLELELTKYVDYSLSRKNDLLYTLTSLLSQGAKLRSEHICFLLIRYVQSSSGPSLTHILNALDKHCPNLRRCKHYDGCQFSEQDSDSTSAHEPSASLLVHWLGRLVRFDSDNKEDSASMSLDFLLKHGQNINDPCDTTGCTILDLIMQPDWDVEYIQHFTNRLDMNSFAFACVLRAGADMSCLSDTLGMPFPI